NEYDATWEFVDGSWHQVTTTPAEFSPVSIPFPTMTYDASTRKIIMIAGQSGGAQPTSTWSYSEGVWQSAGALPVHYGGAGDFVYDPAIGYDVEFGDNTVYNSTSQATLWINSTWLYSSGTWTNASIAGPPHARILPAMTFDAADGYLLLYGGNAPPASRWYNDTWALVTPPVALRLSVRAAPEAICSAVSQTCGLSTDETQVTLSASAQPAVPGIVYGADDGSGTTVSGPYYWVDEPSLTFVGTGNFSLAEPFEPQLTCTGAGGDPRPCPSSLNLTSAGGGETAYTWQWGGTGAGTLFRAGDSWNVSFILLADGPPYGHEPIDRCSTNACAAAGWSTAEMVSSVAFGTPGSNPTAIASFPIARVTVLPPQPSSNPPPGTSPPPPPPPTGSPIPVGGSPVATPVNAPGGSLGALNGIRNLISPTGAAVGIVAAGLTRVAVSRPARAIRVG
ncbi:hypothetical protein B1B_15553, partial [mine drainage metagenome]